MSLAEFDKMIISIADEIKVDKITLTKGFDKIANSEFIRIQVSAGTTTYGHTIYEKHHQGGWQDLINEGYTDMSDLKFKDPDDE
jgi:hypothetical protein